MNTSKEQTKAFILQLREMQNRIKMEKIRSSFIIEKILRGFVCCRQSVTAKIMLTVKRAQLNQDNVKDCHREIP